MDPKKRNAGSDALLKRLLRDIEEEDIGISLFSTFYQDQEELRFFSLDDRAKVLNILQRLAEDSKRHKTIVLKIIGRLEARRHEN
ncbi:MAG TPA: hypothetical protein VL688_03740 [Verrucomicrobiae bacterium]|jgi:hypothetical protein|nr:hypothetical protein [Verrucomicrobiae bacterium]